MDECCAQHGGIAQKEVVWLRASPRSQPRLRTLLRECCRVPWHHRQYTNHIEIIVKRFDADNLENVRVTRDDPLRRELSQRGSHGKLVYPMMPHAR